MSAGKRDATTRSAGRDAVEDHIVAALTNRRQGAQALARGLPLARLMAPERNGTLHVVVTTTIDGRGRVADRSPLRLLGWGANHPVAVSLAQCAPVIIVRPGGSQTISGQGHLRLPLAIRRVCRLEARDRLLVVAFPRRGLLAAYPMATVDVMLLAYHASPTGEPVR